MGFIGAALVSLYGGLYEDLWYIWLGGIIVALIFVFITFPHVWMYSFWFAGMYALCIFGGIMIFALGRENTLILIGGIAVEIGAYYVMYVIWWKTIKLRDSSADEYYTPLGLWSIALMSFFLISNLSVLTWSQWAIESRTIMRYVFSEGVLILLLGYLLWVPETFSWEPLIVPMIQGEEKIMTAVPVEDICSVCGTEFKMERGFCPSCGSPRVFRWCPVCEQYSFRCENCKEFNLVGEKKCRSCKTALPEGVHCRSCGEITHLDKWKIEKVTRS